MGVGGPPETKQTKKQKKKNKNFFFWDVWGGEILVVFFLGETPPYQGWRVVPGVVVQENYFLFFPQCTSFWFC